MRVAVVDLGTNSCRLLLGEVEGGLVRSHERAATVTRLGRGVDRTRALDPPAVERTVACLEGYAARIEAFAPQARLLIATSVLRDAHGGERFLDGMRERFGLPWRILTGPEEALLSFAGAASAFPQARGKRIAVVDIGGGSTEFAIGEPGAAPFTRSLDVGSVRLTERFFATDPPTDREWAAAQRFGADLLAGEIAPHVGAVALAIGVAGTITTLAAYKLDLRIYDSDAVHGHVLTLADIAAAIERLRSLPSAQRALLAGIQKGRADVILAGTLIAEQACLTLGVDGLSASEADILDGVALRLAPGDVSASEDRPACADLSEERRQDRAVEEATPKR